MGWVDSRYRYWAAGKVYINLDNWLARVEVGKSGMCEGFYERCARGDLDQKVRDRGDRYGSAISSSFGNRQ